MLRGREGKMTGTASRKELAFGWSELLVLRRFRYRGEPPALHINVIRRKPVFLKKRGACVRFGMILHPLYSPEDLDKVLKEAEEEGATAIYFRDRDVTGDTTAIPPLPFIKSWERPGGAVEVVFSREEARQD
jgi:hypothetical protein